MSTPTPLLIGPSSPILAHPSTVILDASWLYKPDPPTRNAQSEFRARHLPGARFWSLDDVSEPHPQGFILMLPSPERFAEFAGRHGIKRETHVVVYDTDGVFAAPRTVWTFKVYGHEKVSLIDGGLPRAIAEGVPLESGDAKPFEPTTYPIPTLKPNVVAEYPLIQSISSSLSSPSPSSPSPSPSSPYILLDARPSGSFAGEASDPRSGHIPGARNLPFPDLVKPAPSGYLSLLSGEEFKEKLSEVVGKEQVDDVLKGKKQVVDTCGGGLSAAIIWVALQSIGVESVLYDESWSGYSQREGAVIVQGSE
ncbi:hypothetical protein PLICRDRAFT_180031 [Plicaturopsis crispa FD-325 SS-3]|uniref:Rhodanese domain-containing protein n=1 Tax=Plicaturopsis crispa FD-325 SS-3 TaxID=944288 RepID=A0A0C9T3U8_PLICR|nr:hypothetical protein PLICRDRAFT_180031 [Plicaturopsis crispa FD-325 SS-3]